MSVSSEMAASIIVAFLMLTYLPQSYLVSTVDTTVQVTSANDLYSEAPCELHPLSAFKDVQGNIWGVGNGNLWWFNATNLSWSLLPMPNNTASAGPWRVACVDPRKYVAVIGRNASLVLHLPWQHWQFGDTDDVNVGYVDKDATWCMFGFLFAVDPLRETLYLLDPEEAHWTVRDDMPVVPYVNWSTPYGLVNSWVGYSNELIMVEKFGVYDHVMFTNASATDWVIMGENNSTNLWPDLDQSNEGKSLAWKMGSDHLWLWKEDKGMKELWSFGYRTGNWQRGSRALEGRLPPLNTVLAGWEEGKRYCILKRSSDCTSQYTMSEIECWTETEMIPTKEESENQDPPPRLTTSSTTTHPKQDNITTLKPEKEGRGPNYTSTTRVISAPTATTQIPTSSRSSKAEPPSPMKPVVTKHGNDINWRAAMRDAGVVAVIPAKDPSWHQHTSVFGSVIFFGTSITIFALFGLVWCIRKCVHFPKEALLLRDPPSVRYTAIPDSLGYDTRKATPSTYTVIPDSIA
ncbi:uncharacterized protein NPIL_144851 [Nephila pilipes]|uniref:Uncharacterized protein n=1 Tax=Nephila pilipes TaxID=299642 RepID=A0A8X6UBJ4_NEPPI|nr:uncharacterized protein NPIL_144851 [Nephila pilipes]